MKLGCDSLYSQSCFGHEISPILSNDSGNQLGMLKLDDDATDKVKANPAESIAEKGFKGVDRSQHYNPANKALINQQQSESECMNSTPCNSHHKIEVTDTDKEHCADRAAEVDCETMKDLCAAEGLALENILLESTEITMKHTSGFQSSATRADDDLMAEGELPIMQTNSKITSAFVNSADSHISSSLSEHESKLRDDGLITRDSSDKKISFRMGDLNRVSLRSDTIRFDFSSSDKLLIYQKTTDQANTGETCSTSAALTISSTDSTQSNVVLQNNSHVISIDTSKHDHSTEKVESPNIREFNKCSRVEKKQSFERDSGDIPPDFNSGRMIGKGKVKNGNNTEYEHIVYSPNCSAREETILEGVSLSSRCSFYHNNHGELGSTGSFYLSGSKVSSSPVAFSGSISLRSDSSTSTRSFAFPILQPEWPSSPVKMAKADRRHLRRHRRWKLKLLCCKF